MQKTTLRHWAIAALTLLCSATTAHARSFWLLPSDTTLTPADQWVTVDVGMSTAPLEHSVMGLPLTHLRVTAPDGTPVAPQNATVGALRTVFDLPVKQRGSYRLVMVNDSFFATWKDPTTGNPVRWRGTAQEFAQKVPTNASDVPELQAGQMLWRIESFITVGAPTPLPAANYYADQGLEMRPVTHPNDLAVGEAAQFAFHLNGKPAADLEITLTPGGFRWRNSADVIRLTTNAQGQIQVRWPAAGMYLINASAKDEQGDNPLAKQRQLFYAGTVEVLP